MALNSKQTEKLFYGIGEVAQMFSLNESTLRYWENEFPNISPRKSKSGKRQYTKDDIENIRLVYHLVKEKGLTIQGAKSHFKVNKEKTIDMVDVITKLQHVRDELSKMQAELSSLT